MVKLPGENVPWTEALTGATFINETSVDPSDIEVALRVQNPEMAAMVSWARSMQHRPRNSSLWNRDRYVTPENIFDQFKVALDAVETDDVVSGVVESTEALAFNKVSMYCEDRDQQDVWNQIAADINLDSLLREMWRELFTVSQFYAAIVWGEKQYNVRGRTKDGIKRKKSFGRLTVPISVALLDPLKVIPHGNFMFGQEQLLYIAEPEEAEGFDDVLAGENTTDLVVASLFESRFRYPENEDRARKLKRSFEEMTDKNCDNLFVLNPENVFRHTATRPDYARWATCRMKSCFEILDMKHNLRAKDRAFLLGGTNFIILVKKGAPNEPAQPGELERLASQVRTVSQVPIIVGDHRLSVEIVTPMFDSTLKQDSYNILDDALTARLYLMFMSGGSKGDDSIKLARVIARGMESRRHMIRRTLESKLWAQVYEKNPELTEVAKMRFHPKRIALDFDNNIASYMQDLRERGDLSRDTALEELDINQEEEARKRQYEKDSGLDDIFTPVFVPWAPGLPKDEKPPENPKPAGRNKGGTKNGGGRNRNSTQPNSDPVRPRGNR